ncbi:MAG: hypothetical protein ACXWWC_12730 [Chitinophagaceae bacterium]
MIEQHEDMAVFALIAFILSGIVSLIGIFLTLRKSSMTRAVALIILVISLISFGLVARTGYSGGQIRHTEINAKPALPGAAGENGESD